MKIQHIARTLVLAATLFAAQVAIAPMAAADHVTCFLKATPPFKAGSAVNAPIGFGYQVSCTGRPDGRQIEYVLRRNGSNAAFGSNSSTDPNKTEVFYYECSPQGGGINQFQTYVAMIGQHRNIDFTEDTSISVALQC